MARITKDPDERRGELIATAQELFYTKGYENTSVRDIVKAVGVAQGTFYYYFDSKQAILEAVVAEQMTQKLSMYRAIVDDDTLNVSQKWTQLVRAFKDWRIVRETEILALLKVMRISENLPLFYKLQVERSKVAIPEYTKLVTQGVAEGVFETEYVEEAAEIIYHIASTFSSTLDDIFLNPGMYDDPEALVRRKVAATQTAIERVLGAAPGSMLIIDEPTLATWFGDGEGEDR
ncbi:MAG: TetR/AcrR family transcriptional regulator [Anaerolineae bacterium]|nr:TetR/AcrR family transcriptional regulator [Anaerolineae bacterium]